MKGKSVKFVLEVDLDGEALNAAPVEELGRILRYWAGNVKHYPLAPGSGETIRDSGYAAVGSWRIENGND